MYLLFLSTLLSFISVYSHFFGKPVSTILPLIFLFILPICFFFKILYWLEGQTSRERSLIMQKRELQRDQSSISMADNFASYSKVQRKINALDQELSEIREERRYKNFKYRFFLQYGLRFVFGIVLVVLSIYYKREPVFSLSRKFDLAPFSKIISYPNEENNVSFHFWVLCSTAVARLLPLPK